MKIGRLFKNTKGVSIVVYTIALTVLMTVAATVVDIGNVMAEHQKLQTAVDAITLAAAQELPDASDAREVAYQYAGLNGLNESDITVTFSNSNKKIKVSANKKVNYFFARVLGYDDTTADCKASAALKSMGAAFDYALFSGSTSVNLNLNGSGQYIKGDVHTNKTFITNGSNLTITGACEAVGQVTVNGSKMDIGEKLPNSPFVDMPDFSEQIKEQAQEAGKAYAGDKVYDGSYVNVDSSIYANGSVYFNGSHFTGKGCILAKGDIIFNGSNVNASSGDAVCFYSESGNIYFNGSNAELYGIVYAPKGNIIFNGSHQTVYGRVIGNVVAFNGSNLRIISGESEMESLPSHGIRLVE